MCRQSELVMFLMIIMGYKVAQALPNAYSTSTPITLIPGALTQEEQEIMKDLELRNEKIRKSQDEFEMGKPMDPLFGGISPAPNWRPGLMDVDPVSNSIPLTSRDRLVLLHERLALLEEELRQFHYQRRILRISLETEFEAGPCNRRDDVPTRCGMSRRMLYASDEGVSMNYCNLMLELTREIDRTSSEISRMRSHPTP